MLNPYPKRVRPCLNDIKEIVSSGSPPPVHDMEQQAISLRIAAALLQYAQNGKLGRVLHSPRGIAISKNAIRPDVIFVARERSGVIGKSGLYAPPDLIADVLSPDSQAKDLRMRKRLYEFFMIKEYWIADPHTSTIEVLFWSEMGYLLTGKYGIGNRFSSPLLPRLNLALRRIFRAGEN
ncbi:MAG: Uma2 family endonuclease [Acidobacteria bacterium]|nr:Uma2 family endonuclease [Acidobacteriota bacterium]